MSHSLGLSSGALEPTSAASFHAGAEEASATSVASANLSMLIPLVLDKITIHAEQIELSITQGHEMQNTKLTSFNDEKK